MELENKRRFRIGRERLRGQLSQSRFLVPNAVTVGHMFCGFLAIMYAASGKFEKAALAIGFAILLDGLDGRVARKLNATSKFGGEFDSFADLTSFGLAPAVLVYHWCFQQQQTADEFGILIAFIYALCAASRLARFNISATNLKSFSGLPSPGAAGAIVALVNCFPLIEANKLIVFGVMLLMVTLGFLMVSTIEFFSIKKLRFRGIRFSTRILVGGLIALLWYKNQVGFLVIAGLYALSGPVQYFLNGSQSEGDRGETQAVENKTEEPETNHLN